MDVKYDLSKLDTGRVVYVKRVLAGELPEDVRTQMGGRDAVYAVHRAEDGERLAFVKDRKLAFALARQNDLAPVTVH